MKNFLIYTLATISGIILASLIFFFIMLGSLGAMVAAGEKPVSISDNSILILKAGVPIPDRTDDNRNFHYNWCECRQSPSSSCNAVLAGICRRLDVHSKIKKWKSYEGVVSGS